ncbi:MAG: DUF2520 domain-containing protein [Lentimicrobium sp.]|nr:DUF2520 domain-containing protein [Lentimicrobium sp.]
MGKIKKISLAGSGNVASHLAPAFALAGIEIINIYSPNPNHASLLANTIGAVPINDVALFDNSAECLIIAIPDQAIAEFAFSLKNNGSFTGLIAHTSGSQPLSVLSNLFPHSGVFYPLQTFSKFSHPVLSEVPFCIEASSPDHEEGLCQLAGLISQDVRLINSKQRAMIHLAAVFACNFANHMYALASDILQMAGIKPDILSSLITETANRLGPTHPGFLQTGPAVRGDASTLNFQLQLLNDFPELIPIYRQISESIVKWHINNRLNTTLDQHE